MMETLKCEERKKEERYVICANLSVYPAPITLIVPYLEDCSHDGALTKDRLLLMCFLKSISKIEVKPRGSSSSFHINNNGSLCIRISLFK